MKRIERRDMKTMLWKNGRGTTTEVAVFPSAASLEKGDFVWRISSARFHEAGPFSQFHGFERILVVWAGEGINLNGNSHLPFETISFNGAERMHAIPSGPICDLGVIFKPDCITAEVNVIYTNRLSLGPGTHFLFCTGDEFTVASETLVREDVVRFDFEHASDDTDICLEWKNKTQQQRLLLVSVFRR